MTRAGDLNRVTVRSFGIPPFKLGMDDSVLCRYHYPTRLAPPGWRRDDGFEIVSRVEHLGARHESGPLNRQVGREVFMKLPGVEVRKPVCRLLYRGRLAEVTGKALAIVRLTLASVGHVGRHVHQAGNGGIRPGFGDDGTAITMRDKNALSILLSEDPFRGSDIFPKVVMVK